MSIKSVLLVPAYLLLFTGTVVVADEAELDEAEAKIDEERIVREFHKLFHEHKGFQSRFLGIPSIQYPTDNWVMQEIIYEVQPDFIIETGTAYGGTALFYANILDLIGKGGKVITVDIMQHVSIGRVTEFDLWKERVEFIKGDSVSAVVVREIRERVKGHRVLVTLDSLHTKEHVLQELELYAPLVSVGSYLVVQDTHFGGHPLGEPGEKGGGPWAAVEEFLKKNDDFVVDKRQERYLITQNPSGFLKRIS